MTTKGVDLRPVAGGEQIAFGDELVKLAKGVGELIFRNRQALPDFDGSAPMIDAEDYDLHAALAKKENE
jgi:hypothetical protein